MDRPATPKPAPPAPTADAAAPAVPFDWSDYATSPDKENSGVWFDCDLARDLGLRVPAGTPVARFKLGRIGSDRYQERQRVLTEQHRNTLRAGGALAAKCRADITLECFAHDIVLDWREVVINGVSLPCNPENVTKLLSLRGAGVALRDWISNKAGEIDPYRFEEDEAGKGN